MGASLWNLPVDASAIQVLFTPTEFYRNLRVLYSSARQRAVVSCLYIGNGQPERKVLLCLRRVQRRCLGMQVRVLVDYNRSLRLQDEAATIGEPRCRLPLLCARLKDPQGIRRSRPLSSTSLYNVAGLLSPNRIRKSSKSQCKAFRERPQNQSFPSSTEVSSRTRISLFCHPLLLSSGFFKPLVLRHLPHRMREALGVMHMKIFLADDTVILTGANLSETYLSNKQDRYWVVRNKLLADVLCSVVDAIQAASFELRRKTDTSFALTWNSQLTTVIPRFPRSCSTSFKYGSLRRRDACCSQARLRTNLYEKGIPSLFPEPTTSNCVTFLRQFRMHLCNTFTELDQFVKQSIVAPCTVSRTCQSTSFTSTSACTISVFLDAGFCGITDFTQFLCGYLEYMSPSRLVIASAYFNPTPQLLQALSNYLKRICCVGADVEASQSTINSFPTMVGSFRWLTSPISPRQPQASSEAAKRHTGSNVSPECYFNHFDFCPSESSVFPSSALSFILGSSMANSFFGSKGLSGVIPLAYDLVTKHSFGRIGCTQSTVFARRQVNNSTQQGSAEDNKSYGTQAAPIRAYKFERSGWTFHPKGVWVFRANLGGQHVQSTIIGSSNYNCRGSFRDLELNFYLELQPGNNATLQRDLGGELEVLRRYLIEEPVLGSPVSSTSTVGGEGSSAITKCLVSRLLHFRAVKGLL